MRLLRQPSRRQVDTKGRDGLRKYRLQGPNVANDEQVEGKPSASVD